MAQPLGLDVFSDQDASGPTDRPRRSGSLAGAPLDEALVGTIASAEGLNPTQQRVMTALLQQESGYGRNTSTSVNGAQGAGQIIPDTFRRYAKPGERIDNPQHNLAVMARIVKDLGGKTGDDPARIATGYFSGEGNIAREGTQAWKNDAADGNGKRVSGYVTDVVGRLESVPEPAKPAQAAGPDLSKAPAWASIKAKPEFLALSKEDKAAAKQAYFDYWIAPNGGDDALRQKFMATEDADGLNAGLAVEQFKSGVAGLQSGYYSNAARNNAALLNAMDKMDRGERVPIDQDPVGYSEMNPEQRKAIREQVTGSFAGSAARAVKYTGEQKQYKSNPAAKAAVDLADKGDYRGAWNAFKSDPAGVIQQLSVESAPNAIPAAVAAATGVALGGGVAGFMTGLAGGNFPVEFAASVAESLQESGVNMEDYGAVEAKLRDPAFIKAAGQRAVTRGSVIAAADMAGGGLALPLKAGLRQIPKNVLRVGATGAAEISTEMAGEAAAQAASGEEFKVGQILAEGLGAGPQTVGMSLGKTVAQAAKKPETITPDGRLEAAPPTPPVNPLQQSADTIVEQLANQAGIPRETVLPTAPAAPTAPTAQTAPQGQPPAAESFTDEDVLGFAQTRLDALTIKRDGERVTTMGETGPVDQTVPGVGLSAAEQAEIDALEQAMATGQPQALRDLYGLNDQAPAVAPNVPPVEPNVPAAESEADREARLEREAIQNEAPAAQDQQDDIEIPGFAPPRTEKEARERRAANGNIDRSQSYRVDSEDRGTFGVTVRRLKDGGVLIDDDGQYIEYNADFARGKSDEDIIRYVFEPVGYKSVQQEPNATQPEQVAGQATPAQGPQDGAGTAAPAAGAQDVRQPGAANERLIDSLPLEDNTEIQVIEQPGGITVRVFDKDSGQPAPGVRVFPKDREQDAFAYAVELAAKSTPKEPKTEKEARERRAQQGDSNAGAPGQVATQDVRPEGDQPTGDAGVRQGAGGSTGGAVVADTGASAPSGGTNQSVRGTQPQSDGALEQPTGAQRLDQRIRSDVARKNEQPAPEPKRGQIGGKLAGGEVVLTNTGRKTTPFPKINTETERKAGNTFRARGRWLIANALSEAQARGDRFNGRQFQAVNNLNPTQSDKDSAEQYLFGETIPPVVPSILKPLTNPSDSPAVNDFLEGRRPDAPTYDEVSKEQANPQASTNTVFTEDAAAKAREILKRKLNGSQLNSGIDPEVMQAGITLAGYHIEKGARTFAAYAKAMIGDLGDVVRPYLKSWYMGVKYDPRAAGFDGMDSAATVEAADAFKDPEQVAPPATEKEARNRRAQPVEKPATPPQKDSPTLSGRKVTFDVLVEDTGQTAQVTVDAAREDEDLTARESAMRELIDCLRK